MIYELIYHYQRQEGSNGFELCKTIEPELQFQPDAAARYVVVDEVLADIRRSGVTNLGFVGNERYATF